MKKILFATLFFFFLIKIVSAQIPTLTLQDTTGNNIELSEVMNEENKNYLITFWATWCAPCKKELDAWKPLAPDWINKYNTEVIAISVDNERSRTGAKTMWLTKEWVGKPYFADNSEAGTMFGFASIPQLYLFNSNGDIIYEHSGYIDGDEIKLDSIISANAPSSSAGPILTYIDSTTIDYGTIVQDSDPERTWRFYNSGDEPLLIINGRGTSGACLPIWPETPIEPGDTAEIINRYNTNRLGLFNKRWVITTNELDENGDNKLHTVIKIGNVIRNTNTVDNFDTNKVNVYPTVIHSDINIEFENIPFGFSFDVYDNVGRLIKSQPLLEQQTQVSFLNFSKGIYYLSIQKNGKNIIRKLIKS